MALAQDNPSCLVTRRHIRSVIMGSTMYNSSIIYSCQMKKVIRRFFRSSCLNCRRTKWRIMTHQLLTRYLLLQTSVLLHIKKYSKPNKKMQNNTASQPNNTDTGMFLATLVGRKSSCQHCSTFWSSARVWLDFVRCGFPYFWFPLRFFSETLIYRESR